MATSLAEFTLRQPDERGRDPIAADATSGAVLAVFGEEESSGAVPTAGLSGGGLEADVLVGYTPSGGENVVWIPASGEPRAKRHGVRLFWLVLCLG